MISIKIISWAWFFTVALFLCIILWIIYKSLKVKSKYYIRTIKKCPNCNSKNRRVLYKAEVRDDFGPVGLAKRYKCKICGEEWWSKN